MSYTEIAKNNKTVRWVDINTHNAPDRVLVEKNFDFLESDIDDAFGDTTRSKIVKRRHYAFLLLTLPVFQKETHSIQIEHIGFFLTPKTLVTVHRRTIPALAELFHSCHTNKKSRDELMGDGVDMLLLEILQQVIEHTYPMIEHVIEEVEELEEIIFSGQYNRKTVEKTLLIKRNITDLRRCMRGHPDTLQHLVKKHTEIKSVLQDAALFESIIEHAYENWAQLESLKESIDALEDANESLLSHDLNDTMKLLTLLSVLLLPAVVLTGIFGMNTKNPPLIGHAIDFWLILGVILISSLAFVVIIILARQRWR